jgi:sulfur carrier protein
MKVTVNGTEKECPEGLSLGALCGELEVPDSGIAVAIDGQIVTRGQWPATELHDGARVEVLTAVGGG